MHTDDKSNEQLSISLATALQERESLERGVIAQGALIDELTAENTRLKAEMQGMVRVGVLLRWINKPKTGFGWWGISGKLIEILTKRMG